MVIGGMALFFVTGMQLAWGALTGAGVGSMLGGYIGESYGYDFNSSYALGMGAGALLGAGVAYAAPFIGQFMSTSWSFGSQASISSAGQMILTGGITLTGTQILVGTGTLALGLTYLFSKGHGPRMGHNQYENQQFRNVMKTLGIQRSDPRWRFAHDSIQGMDLDDYQELLEYIKTTLGLG